MFCKTIKALCAKQHSLLVLLKGPTACPICSSASTAMRWQFLTSGASSKQHHCMCRHLLPTWGSRLITGSSPHTRRRHIRATRALDGKPLSSVDEILEGIKDTAFGARTLDYDADSDSSSSDDELLRSYPEAGGSSTATTLENSGDSEDEDVFGDNEEISQEDEDEEDEPPVPSSSAEGPIMDIPPGISWAKPALAVAQRVLGGPEMAGLELYSFRAAAVNDRLYIRLDKLYDPFGSPSMEDVTAFSRIFYAGLEADLGEEAAGKLQIEVSSPGAERNVRVPKELLRFQDLPMQVTWAQEAAAEATETKVLQLLGWNEEAGSTEWVLADVKVNRQKRLGRLTKKEADTRFNLPLESIRHVRLHLDI